MNASHGTTVIAANTPAGTTTDCLLIAPNGGERLRFVGASTMRLKLASATSASVAFYEYVSEPGATGAPQHVHHAHDETFYVVDGTYEFTIGNERAVVPQRGFLHVPRGTPHTFRNTGSDLGRIVGTFSPARFADYFRELATIITETGTVPDHDQWAELYGRYDTNFYEGS